MVEVLSTHSTKIRRELFKELYRAVFPKVARYVSKKGGTLEDAKDVFQSALIIFYEQSVANSENVENEAGYIFGIARHLWSKTYKSEIVKTNLTDERMNEYQSYTPSVDSQKLLNHIRATGKKCLEMLKSFYYEKQSMGDLAENFGFSSVRSATVQKYKCLEKVRDMIKQKSLVHEDFLN